MADDLATDEGWDRGRYERFRAALFDPLVRARLVIVSQELLDHRLQVASAEDPRWSSSSRRPVPINLSAIELVPTSG